MTEELNEQDIEKLEEEIKQLEFKEKTEREKELLKKRLSQLKAQEKQREYRQKHPRLLKITGAIGQGTKRIFKSIGSGISKTTKAMPKIAEALNKSDAWIDEQYKKEREQEKKQVKQKPKSNKKDIDDALGLID